jgi:hypothetical protein
LRGYSRPLNLQAFDRFDWMCNDEGAQEVADGLENLPRYAFVTDAMIKELGKVNSLTYRAGMLNTIPEGLYKSHKKQSNEISHWGSLSMNSFAH